MVITYNTWASNGVLYYVLLLNTVDFLFVGLLSLTSQTQQSNHQKTLFDLPGVKAHHTEWALIRSANQRIYPNELEGNSLCGS